MLRDRGAVPCLENIKYMACGCETSPERSWKRTKVLHFSPCLWSFSDGKWQEKCSWVPGAADYFDYTVLSRYSPWTSPNNCKRQSAPLIRRTPDSPVSSTESFRSIKFQMTLIHSRVLHDLVTLEFPRPAFIGIYIQSWQQCCCHFIALFYFKFRVNHPC